MSRANVFTVSVSNGHPIMTRGFTVIRESDAWRVPLGECIGCGVDKVLPLSTSNPPEIIFEEGLTDKGRVINASVTGGRNKKLQRPDDASRGLKALVLLDHYDELRNATAGEPFYVVAQGTGSIFELYRGQRVQFRCPRGVDLYQLSYDGHSLRCEALAMDGRPEGQPTTFTGFDVEAARLEPFAPVLN